MRRRIVLLFLSLCMVLISTSCTDSGKSEKETKGTDKKTVTDGAYRTVPIPENGKEEQIASVYGTAVPFIVALRLTDQVKAINCKSNFWKKAVPALDKTTSVGKGNVDLEALASSGATVLIHRANDPDTVKAVEKLGINVLCIRAEDMDGIHNTLRLMGDYFGKKERAEEVIDWIDKKFDEIDSITKKIPENERRSALVMGGKLGRIAGGDMIQTWMIEKAGGIPVAAKMNNDSKWMDIGVETVFKWDPEFIFCTSSASLDYTVDEIMKDDAWNDTKSVLNGHVYQIPSKLDTWDMPGITDVICTFWMLHKMYPEYLDLDKLKSEIDEYYEFMFDKTFEASYLGYELT